MKLAHDWKQILCRAWSVRFIVAAFILTFLEALIPFAKSVGLAAWLPGGIFSIAAALLVALAFVSRLIAQEGLEG